MPETQPTLARFKTPRRMWSVRIFKDAPISESIMGASLAEFMNRIEAEGLEIQHVTQSYDPPSRTHTFTVFCSKPRK